MIPFSLYFLTFMLTEADINNRTAELLGAGPVNPVYAGGLLCTAGGYLLYGVLCKRFAKQTLGKGSAFCALLLNFLSLVWPHPTSFLLGSFFCLLSLGMVGGYLHEQVGNTRPSGRLGTDLGLSMAGAILLQFVLQNSTNSHFVATALLLLLTISIAAPFFGGSDAAAVVDAVPQRPGIFWESTVVVLMSCILALQDSIVVLKNANGEIALFSYVRLFYALGLLLAGLLADWHNGCYFTLFVICAAFVSTIAIAAFRGGSTYFNLSMMAMYFYSGFYVMFLTHTYIQKGRGQANSGLISGLGRVLRSVATAVVVMAMIPFSGHESLGVISALSCLFAIAILVFAFFGKLLLPVARAAAQPEPAATFREERFERFFEQYSLTDREREVFRLFVTTEEENQFIADTLGISRRVLQRHIAAIYEKTGTCTRVGLLQKFIEK